MEHLPFEIINEEYEFYGEHLILLEGAIEEFLSCLHMIRRYQVSRGQRDPVASFQARIKSAGSMKPNWPGRTSLSRRTAPFGMCGMPRECVWCVPLCRTSTRQSD